MGVGDGKGADLGEDFLVFEFSELGGRPFEIVAGFVRDAGHDDGFRVAIDVVWLLMGGALGQTVTVVLGLWCLSRLKVTEVGQKLFSGAYLGRHPLERNRTPNSGPMTGGSGPVRANLGAFGGWFVGESEGEG